MPAQVYSTELVTTLGSACKRLLDGLAAHMGRPRSHDGGRGLPPDPHLAPRVIFALLQNPLNGAFSHLSSHWALERASVSVHLQTCAMLCL